jgi:hypothetical protein
MSVQEMARTVTVVALALGFIAAAFFIVGSILITLAMVVPAIIVVALVAGLLFGDKQVTIHRHDHS